MIETQIKEPCGVSSTLEENFKVQGSEEEKNEVKKGFGSLKSVEDDECCKVDENGVGVKSLCDDGVVEVKSSFFETEVSVLRENDYQGSDGSIVCEKLDCEGRVEEDAVLNGDGVVVVDAEERKDGNVKEKDENCDVKIVTIEVPIVETSEGKVEEVSVLSGDGVVVVDGEERKDENVKESDEREKGENCDGKIATIEVPIVEISENNDVEMEDLIVEDLIDESYGFSVGDFVWGKIKSHPWWPGRVYEASDASDFALKVKQKNRLLVAYFGDGTFAWCHPSQLKPFKDNFEDMVRQSCSKGFTNAVQEAVNEVRKILIMKMSRSFAAEKTMSEFVTLSAKNSGIKEGVLVPESGIERLSSVTVEPAELLSQMKQIAEIIDVGSVLELEFLKARLSAFFLLRGGYKLPVYEDPKRVSGLEDKDDTVDVETAVEAQFQGPFEEDYSTLPLSPKSGEPCHSPEISGSRSNRRRKQKSIADIMWEDKDKDVHTKNKEEDASDEVLDAIASRGRKKRKDSEDVATSKPVRKRKEFVIDTDGNSAGSGKEGRGDKKNSDKVKSLHLNKKKEAFGNESVVNGSKEEENDEGKSKEENEKGFLSRERKKSKYLSPPFTTSIRELVKGSKGTKARDAVRLSSPISKCNSVAFLESKLSDSSNHQTQDDEEKAIDPEKVKVSSAKILSKLRSVAISPQISREGASFDRFVDFILVMRSSLYREGSLYKAYKKVLPGRKRKKPESKSELEMLGKDQNQSDHVSPDEDSAPIKRRKEKKTTSVQKSTRASETKTGEKGTDEKSSAAVLFVSFWPGSTLPSKSDLITMYSKFGALNELETDMFRTNYTARVSFLRTHDAEKALNHSQNKNPFESSEVTFQLQYASSDGSKSVGEHSERSKSKASQYNKQKSETPTTPSVSPSQGSEKTKLSFIKGKLQGLVSMLESSDEKSPEFKTKLEINVKSLLEDVNKMAESTSS